jgi:antitoxin (DNA-binding transcriptional repressor) of toxin-antitoxin stability system
MRTISLLEFRKNAQATLQKVAAGQSIVLTRRGQAVARLEPVGAERIQSDDPLYTLGDLAVEGDSLTNEEMDRDIYGR